MKQAKILIQKLTSPDGKISASAKSVAIASGDNKSKIYQSVTVKISPDNSSSSSSSFSSSSTKIK